MRRLQMCALMCLLLLSAAPAVLGNIAPPDKNPRRDERVRKDLPSSRMTIEAVDGLREARLQVPRSLLGQLPAAPGVAQGTSNISGSFRPLSTVVGGLFLTLSVVLAGLLLLRARGRSSAVSRVAASLLVCAVAAAALAVVGYANAGLPPPVPIDSGTLRKAVSGKSLAGSVRVEIVEEGSEIKLLVPTKSRGDDEEE